MKISFNKLSLIHLLIQFLLIGVNANAQDFDSLKSEYDFDIRLESDSILLIRKSSSYMVSAFISSRNKICLNANIYNARHYHGNGICYELEGFKDGKFVSYQEFDDGFGLDVNYSGVYYTELSKQIKYEFNPFDCHHPVSNRVYRFRLFLRLQDKVINTSEWKYVYAVRKKKQIKEVIKSMRRLVSTYQFKSQKADPLKYDWYLKKAQYSLEQNEYEKARDYSLKVIELDSLNGNAYVLVGLAYIGYANVDEIKYFPKKMIYCLAVDQFQKAKAIDPNVRERAQKLIQIYSKHFLRRDEFYGDFREGDKYTVGYWINEETTVRFSN
ncbi:tetratricopeptide repeat protein [Marinifilum fragile]|uniref:tetratricopeptide repeat protein n=1 Tax=Marinifilum fragile TaxID=570161 RepID=UPI0006D1E96F|nr:hypothetical protein [Marinifilum fragile]